MDPTTAILAAVAVPLAGAGLIVAAGRSPNLREAVTLVTAVLLFVDVLTLVPGVVGGGRPGATVVEMFPGLVLAFEVEPLGMLFALVASGLWILNSAYSIGYMRGTGAANQTRYYAYFALSLAATMGVAFAGNMLTLFVFYELLTLSTYPLVTHYGDARALKAGRTYVGLLMATSIGLLMLAMIWTWQATGTVAFTPGGILAQKAEGPWVGVLLFLYMFGIGKAALMPIHRWLPAAMVAPTPVSALLHAVAVVKAGVFTVLKVAVYIFGIDLVASLTAADWLAYIAAATMLGASLVAMTKDNLKARLAYSTVSNLAFVVLAAMLANAGAIVGGGMHIAMHGFGKITLFFCAGAIYVATHKTEISEMAGIGRQMPFTMAAFLIGALSVIGLPPFGGAWSKWHVILGAVEADQLIFVLALILSSMLNVAYLIPIVARAFFVPDTSPASGLVPRSVGAAAASVANDAGAGGGIREAPLFCVVPLSLTALGCFVLFFYADAIVGLLTPITVP